MIFSFMQDANNYEDRKVARYEKDDLLVSTCKVSDSKQPYETAIAHPNYNNGNIVIVEMYDNYDDAEDGHNKWVLRMTTNPPPYLRDVSSSFVSILLEELGNDDFRHNQLWDN